LTTDNTHTTHNTTQNTNTHTTNIRIYTQRHTNTHHNDKLAAHTTNNYANTTHETRHIQTTHTNDTRNVIHESSAPLFSPMHQHTLASREARVRGHAYTVASRCVSPNTYTQHGDRTRKSESESESTGAASNSSALSSQSPDPHPATRPLRTTDHQLALVTYHLSPIRQSARE